jgi:hypothetical protein
MITRVILPLLILPVLILAVFSGLSYYWYNQTSQILSTRLDQYKRLEAAKNQLSTLEPQETELKQLRSRFSDVDNAGSLDAVKLYLSKKSNPTMGVKLEDYRLLGQSMFVKNYGAISLKFTCRSEALALYLADAMNVYPNLVFTAWDLEPSNKLLQFNSTAVLAKISPN